MWKQAFQDSDMLGFAIFALLFFVTFFAGVVVVTLLRGRRHIDSMAALPLADDSGARPARTGGEVHG